MSSMHQLSWHNFESSVLVPGQQRVHRIADSPVVEVFGDGAANRIGIVFEVPSDSSVPPNLARLSVLSARVIRKHRGTFLEIATSTRAIHRQFYHFCMAAAERVLAEGWSPADAMLAEAECFGDLLREKSILGVERQIGLLGELLFLETLTERYGTGAIDAWIGPASEPHDFRLGHTEFEVKSTVLPKRAHVIHGSDQLVASAGCVLHLISVMLGPAGGDSGFSLGQKALELSRVFGDTPTHSAAFVSALAGSGCQLTDAEHYGRKYAIRRRMAIVPVDDRFPAVTRQSIRAMLGPLAARVGPVQYEVDVEGLEYEMGTPPFETALCSGVPDK